MLLLLFAMRADGDQFFDDLSSMKLPDLVWKGKRYVQRENKVDSGLMCLTFATKRYDKSLSRDDKEAVLDAYYALWHVYLFYYNDFVRSNENLLKASSLCNELRLNKGMLLLYFGNMYQLLSEQTEQPGDIEKACDYYVKSFDEASATGEKSIMVNSFTNLVSLSIKQGMASNVDEMFSRLVALKDSTPSFRYAMLLYESVVAQREGRYADAVSALRQQEKHLPDEAGVHYFYLMGSLSRQADLFIEQGDWDAALDVLGRQQRIAREQQLPDALLNAFKQTSLVYRQMGNTAQADSFSTAFLLLKDSMLNQQQLSNVDEVAFLENINRIDEHFSEVHQRNQRQRTMLLFIGGACIIAILLFVLIWRSNVRLRETNTLLYKKNVEMMRAYDEAQRQRSSSLAETPETPLPTKDDGKETTSVADADEIVEAGPLLDDAAAQQLWQRLQDILESNNEVFDAKFSVNRLTEIAHSQYRFVAWVIRTRGYANFGELLSEYRVREACRRFANPDYRNYTIEAIANSVGYRSRTTFVAVFKRNTGITPSVYQKNAVHDMGNV